MGDHPTILELELHRTGAADPGVGAHAASCAACRAKLDSLERLARDQATVFPIEVLAELDAQMEELARRHAARVRAQLAANAAGSRSPRPRRLAPWAAAAAGIAIVAAAGALWRGGLGSSAPFAPAEPRIARPDDVNRDGRVDVLDAFALARALDAGRGRPEWDVNRDGAVDAGDVDAVALAAVSLGGGGR